MADRSSAAPRAAGSGLGAIAGLMTLVPNFGGVIALLGPAFSILVSQPSMYRLCILLGLYAVIVVIDQLMLQPLIMKRVTRVPVWASILAPIVLGIIIPFWGILLAPPLLAVVYAFRRPPPLDRRKASSVSAILAFRREIYGKREPSYRQ